MFTIYSKPNCPWCDRAKHLLTEKQKSFEEFILDLGQDKKDGAKYISIDELRERVPGIRTVPQIFSGEQKIGGFQELANFLSI